MKTYSTQTSELIESLQWRYATKKFDPSRIISDADLLSVMEAMRLSPSSMGLQPYHFFLIQNSELRALLREKASNQSQITEASHLLVITAKRHLEADEIASFVKMEGEARGHSKDSIDKRIASIGRFVNSKDSQTFFNWCAKQAYIALGFGLAAAANLRIDSCPMEGFNNQAFDEILGLDTLNLGAVAVLALGYRSSEDQNQFLPKVRKLEEDLFSKI